MRDLRSRTIRLAASYAPESEERRLLLSALQKSAGTAPAVLALVEKLDNIPGVAKVWVTDTWHDGYHLLRVRLQSKSTLDIKVQSRSPSVTVYEIPDYQRTVALIRKVAQLSGLRVESVEGPKKVYEFLDKWDRHHADPATRLNGYLSDEVMVEVYA